MLTVPKEVQKSINSAKLSAALRVFLPSSISGLLCCLLAMVILGGSIGYFGYKNSDFQRDFSYFKIQKASEGNSDFDNYVDFEKTETLGSKFSQNIPLFVFWGAVGAAVYLLLASFIKGLRQAVELGSELGYVNASKIRLLGEISIHFAVRVVAALALLFFLRWFIAVIVPYVLALARITTGDFLAWQSIGYIALGWGLLTISAHIIVICLRLLILRSRIFGQTTA